MDIEPIKIDFDSQEKYDEFLKWIYSGKDNSVEMQNLRKLIADVRKMKKNKKFEV